MIPRWLASLAHVAFGFLTALAVKVSPFLSLIAFLVFIIYELDEQYMIRDQGYRDISEYGFGLSLGILFLLALLIS